METVMFVEHRWVYVMSDVPEAYAVPLRKALFGNRNDVAVVALSQIVYER
jgi:hypothetical protein